MFFAFEKRGNYLQNMLMQKKTCQIQESTVGQLVQDIAKSTTREKPASRERFTSSTWLQN